jgi:glycosyltransferase involved in cell wall biosynthesis
MPVKVCIVTTAFPRWPGDDRGVFVFEAARAVQALGAQVRVIAMHSPGAKTRETIEGLDIIRPRYLWPEKWELLQREGGGLPIMWRTNKWSRLAVLPFGAVHTMTITRYARGCDIVHANWTLSAAAAVLAKFVHRRPVVVTVQGSDVFQAARLPVANRVTTLALRRCAKVLALSQSLADAVKDLGVSAAQVEVVPNGVDLERFQPPAGEREPLILFVGALIERKGVRHLIAALPPVLCALPGYRVVVVGEGGQRTALEEQAATLGISDRTDFVGPQTPQQVSSWMRRAKLFVLPSLEEGLGVVLLEALGSGTPCVGSAVGGIPDVVTPEVGRLVPPADPQALSAALLDILTSPETWCAMSQQARQRAETYFSWRVIGARLMKIYEQYTSGVE